MRTDGAAYFPSPGKQKSSEHPTYIPALISALSFQCNFTAEAPKAGGAMTLLLRDRERESERERERERRGGGI